MAETLMFFLQGIPETAGIIAFSLALIKATFSWKHTFMVGTVLAAISYIMRTLSFFFGLHTFLILFLLILYISKTYQVSVVKSFLTTFLSVLTLGILEFLSNTVFFSVLGLSPQEVTSNQILWSILGLPQAIAMILLAVIVSRILKPERKQG